MEIAGRYHLVHLCALLLRGGLQDHLALLVIHLAIIIMIIIMITIITIIIITITSLHSFLRLGLVTLVQAGW